jgi:hypothetical protein
MAEQITVLQEIQALIRGVKTELDGAAASIVTISKNAREAKTALTFNSPKSVNVVLQKTAEATSYLTETVKQQAKAEKDLVVQLAKKEAALTNTAKQVARQRFEAQQLTKINNEDAILSSRLATNYQKLAVETNKLARRYQDLAAKRVRNGSLTRKEDKELRTLTVSVRKNQAALIGIDKTILRNQRNVGNYAASIKGLGLSFRSIISAFGITSGIFIFADLIRDATQRIVEFDKQLIAVGKTTDLSKEQLKAFGDEAIDLGLRLKGISISGLLEASEVAGQLGIRGTDNILRFAETIEKLGLTSDLVGQEAARNFAKFIEVSNDSVENADRLGSVITQLGNNFATTEGQILKNTVEIQKGLAIYETSAQGVIALGTATSALGSEAEASRGAFQKTFKVLNEAATNGKNLEQILALTGQTQAEFIKEFNTNSVKTFQKLIKGLAKSADEGKNLSNTLAELNLGEKRTEAVVGALAKNYGVLESAMSLANEEYIVNEALNREAAAAAESLASIIGDLKDSWAGLILSLEDGNNTLGRFTKNAISNASRSLGLLNAAMSDSTSLFEKWKLAVNSTTTAVSFLIPWMEDGKGQFHEFAEEQLRGGPILEDTTLELQKQAKGFIELHGSLAPLTEEQQKLIDNQIQINLLFAENPLVEGEDTGVRTLNKINAELKAQIVLRAKTDALDKEALSTIKSKIAALEAERDAIIGKTKAVRENTKALQGSIQALEDTISKLEKLRETTALTQQEYSKFTEEIDNSKAALVRLKDELEGVEIAVTSSLNTEGFDNFEDLFAIAPDDYIEAELAAQLERLQVEKDLNAQLLQQRRTFYDSLIGLAATSIDTVFQMEIQDYQDKIAANNDYYDGLLKNEDLTDKQREALEEERQKKEEQLQKKKEESEKKAFLLGQARALAEVIIDTIRAVAAIKSQAAILLSNPITAPLASLALAQIPFVIGTGAAAGLTIAATTIPEFKDGYLGGDYSGDAKINDARDGLYKEIVERRSGKLEMFNQRNKIIKMEKGDKVHKAGTFNGQDITRQVTMMNMIAQGQKVSDAVVSNAINIDINEKISKEIKKGFSGLAPHRNESINYKKLAEATARRQRRDQA